MLDLSWCLKHGVKSYQQSPVIRARYVDLASIERRCADYSESVASCARAVLAMTSMR